MNTKVALVVDGNVSATRTRPFELQRAPGHLAALLRELASELDIPATSPAVHAVTMTAELSQMFRTKREGVAFVLDAVEQAFGTATIRVFAVDGEFLTPDDARAQPLRVAAANWAATAHAIAARHPDAILIDVGTTTTDIIPIASGVVAAQGWTDPDRLASSELVYSGAVRTPVEAVVAAVPYRQGTASVSAEGFALMGDVHVWRGGLSETEYTALPPDGRSASREFCGERLARIVCADRDMLDDRALSMIADCAADAQVIRIAEAIRRVRERHRSIETAVVAGLGAFIAAAAAQRAGLGVVELRDDIGADAAIGAPAAAVALLCERTQTRAREEREPAPLSRGRRESESEPVCHFVVKIGGSLLNDVAWLDDSLAALHLLARRRSLLVVPGGGVFADAVRDVDRRIGISDGAAHWMAILAMDQYAHLLAERLGAAEVVFSLEEARAAIARSHVAVLAPYRWLWTADPLPHSWDVTSDSIAAWVAGACGATDLIVVKSAGAGGNVVDSCFDALRPAHARVTIVPADRVPSVFAHIAGTESDGRGAVSRMA